MAKKNVSIAKMGKYFMQEKYVPTMQFKEAIKKH